MDRLKRQEDIDGDIANGFAAAYNSFVAALQLTTSATSNLAIAEEAVKAVSNAITEGATPHESEEQAEARQTNACIDENGVDNKYEEARLAVSNAKHCITKNHGAITHFNAKHEPHANLNIKNSAHGNSYTCHTTYQTQVNAAQTQLKAAKEALLSPLVKILMSGSVGGGTWLSWASLEQEIATDPIVRAFDIYKCDVQEWGSITLYFTNEDSLNTMSRVIAAGPLTLVKRDACI